LKTDSIFIKYITYISDEAKISINEFKDYIQNDVILVKFNDDIKYKLKYIKDNYVKFGLSIGDLELLIESETNQLN